MDKGTLITTIISIAVPILSGLTFLAYKHPHAYEKLGLPSQIFYNGLIVIVALFTRNLGIDDAYKKLLQFVPIDKQANTLTLIESLKVTNDLLIVVIFSWVLLWTYLLLLRLLPSVVIEQK